MRFIYPVYVLYLFCFHVQLGHVRFEYRCVSELSECQYSLDIGFGVILRCVRYAVDAVVVYYVAFEDCVVESVLPVGRVEVVV